jgi:hypothetical protein
MGSLTGRMLADYSNGPVLTPNRDKDGKGVEGVKGVELLRSRAEQHLHVHVHWCGREPKPTARS